MTKCTCLAPVQLSVTGRLWPRAKQPKPSIPTMLSVTFETQFIFIQIASTPQDYQEHSYIGTIPVQELWHLVLYFVPNLRTGHITIVGREVESPNYNPFTQSSLSYPDPILTKSFSNFIMK